MTAAVAQTATTVIGTAATSHTVNLPAGLTNGNTLLIIGAQVSPTSSALLSATGYTSILNLVNSGNACLGVLWREVDGTEGSTITVTTAESVQCAFRVFEISGADDPSTNPPEASAGATGNDTAPNPDSLSPAGGSDDYLWLPICAEVDDNDLTGMSDGNYSNFQSVDQTSWVYVQLGTDYRGNTAASEDPGTFTLSSTRQWAAATLAVYPSAGGATITGSGTPASQDAAAAGTAEREEVGSGTPAAQAAATVATAERELPGSGTPASQAAATAGTAERVLDASGTVISQASSAAGTATLGVKLVLTAANGRELRDEDGVVSQVTGWIFEWYDKTTDTDGNPDVTGTFDTDVNGEANVQLTGSTLTAGQEGLLYIEHPSDTTIRGIYRIPVT